MGTIDLHPVVESARGNAARIGSNGTPTAGLHADGSLRTVGSHELTSARQGMHIALISTPFVPVPPWLYGGTELVVSELAEGLVRRGHHVELFATGDSKTSAALRSLYREAQWPPMMLADLNHVSWAMQQIRQRGPFDVIHAHSAVALACARLLPDVPMVYTLHHARD